ncbi:MAG: hypothetical protein IPG88_12970 [Gemmatimonadetes bacterium]|nr:hypothetical protein [Gemmatimonadota bacterium]
MAEHQAAEAAARAEDRRSGGEEARAGDGPGAQHVGEPAVAILVAVDLDHGRDAVGERGAEVGGLLLDDVQRGVFDVRVCVGVDEAGDDRLAAGIEDLGAGGNREGGA